MPQRILQVMFTEREKAELIPAEPDGSPLAADEVEGRTLATLVSAGTELEGMYLGEKFPQKPGYAAVFEVENVGGDANDLKPGDRVFCLGPHRSHQRVKARDALRVPDDLPAEVATFARLMGVSMATLTTTAARPPAKVIVTGLGIVGHLAAKIFAACGYEVAAVDPSPARRAMAEHGGIERVMEKLPLDDEQWLRQVDLVIECSGHEQAVLDACRIVRKRGEVSLVGAPWRRRTEIYAQQLLHHVFFDYIILRSGWEWELPLHPTDFRETSTFETYAGALKWLSEGRVSMGGQYSIASPRQCQQVYQDLMHQHTEKLATVFDWNDLS
jgi:threonine dehydrogenase-like Zn-dependent dehydrogenase